MLVSVGQARRTLETLIEDRKLLSRQLAELKHQEQDEDDEPVFKEVNTDFKLCNYIRFDLIFECKTEKRCFLVFSFYNIVKK